MRLIIVETAEQRNITVKADTAVTVLFFINGSALAAEFP